MATSKKAQTKAVSKSRVKKTPARKSAPAKKVARAVKAKKAPAAKAAGAQALQITSFMPSITVNDLSRSLAFYTDVLGFSIGEKWSEGDVVRGAMLSAGGSQLGLSQDDWKLGKDRQKGTGFRIWCDTAQDLNAIAARLKAAGHALTEEPEDHPAWGVRSFSFDDPDGFHFTISRKL